MIRTTAIALAAGLAATATLTGGVLAMSHGGKDIVATAQEAGDFTTLLAAAETAGLVETLAGEGPFTVFAPTDEAFAALPEGTVDDLLMEENRDRLTQVLTMHVIPNQVMAADLSDGMTATTLEGSDLTIGTEGGVSVNGIAVSTPDVMASNGVIHVIDGVIMPEGM